MINKATPTAGSFSVTRLATSTSKSINIASNILTHVSNPGATLGLQSWSSPSASGYNVVKLTQSLLYTNAVGDSADDSFTYTVTNETASATGTITIQVTDPTLSTNRITAGNPTSGQYVVTFLGAPGLHYQVQRTESLSPPHWGLNWSSEVNPYPNTASPVSVTNFDNGSGPFYYRVKLVPQAPSH